MKYRWSVVSGKLRDFTKHWFADSIKQGLDPEEIYQNLKSCIEKAMTKDVASSLQPARVVDGATEGLGCSPDTPICTADWMYQQILASYEVNYTDQKLQETIFNLVDRTARECADFAR